ncbi:uncharacterized protein LOC110838982 [Zootermopsis nevadensis]|uniref:Protein TsetseEP domain-containing protein n=1 Tax=Zootermopsis nevadensis TaxID=136037 RepID=A0A067QJG2_ZOONE|nr:uncharacterized protein LOC110838982 [Zootermopsis nevadensis]KDR09106.1 hypothetical protein L798_01062 [Zootermopsis nevadensis]
MIVIVLLTASFATATFGESGGILGSLGVTLKSLSAESVNTVRDATAPLLQVANQTVLEARSTLQDLGGDVALAVVRARASGWDAAHCAQDKEQEAELVLREAMAKLDGCTTLAAVEVEVPVAVISNLTSEALQRIDTAAGDMAACLSGTGTITCLFDVVRNVTQDVGAVARIIRTQALSAETSVAHVAHYVTTCATGQVDSARRLLQKLNIAGCTQ